MAHYRIIGSVWLLFGVSGLALSAIECVRLLGMGDRLTDGATVSTFIGSGFCVLAATASVSLLRGRSWARVVFAIIAVLLGLYCLSFLAMVGLEFGVLCYVLCWLGVAFVAYTLTVVIRCRPHEQNMG
jgi:multisubunit Na+/H+ antiporter MnhG subunit